MLPSGTLSFLNHCLLSHWQDSAEVTVLPHLCQRRLETVMHGALMSTVPRERAASFGST